MSRKEIDFETLLDAEDENENENDSVIALCDYVGELCGWGEKPGNLTEVQRNFYLNQQFEMQVNNGGISQYFFNAGKFAHETVESLKAIGALKTAAILQSAIDKFPGKRIPKDYDEREEALEAIEESDDEIWEEQEDAFFAYEENLNRLNLDYIRRNLDNFRPA